MQGGKKVDPHAGVCYNIVYTVLSTTQRLLQVI